MPGKASIKNSLRGLLDPVAALLARFGVSPLAVTLAGLLLSVAGAFEIAWGHLFIAGIVLIVSGVCDTLDGSLARRTSRESVFGAFIDSTIDRVTEFLYFGALIVRYGGEGTGGRVAVLLCLVAIGGSYLTSYTRARAEGLGLECRVGWIERPERVAILTIGLLAGSTALFVALVCLAVLTPVTAIQRIIHIRRVTMAKDVTG
jgi:CDP-diacylglycerol--glycerol-3-phosphate 3-phosphatidyltransferase